MIYFNQNNYDEAITAYKKWFPVYPGTEESYTALESLESVYIEKRCRSFLFGLCKDLEYENRI